MTETPRKPLTTYKGTVASKSGDKTVKVFIQYQLKHPKYNKYLKRRTTAHVHDEQNVAGVGDVVEIAKCRPLSKTKTWRIVKVVEKSNTLA